MSLHCIKQLIHRKKVGNACLFGQNTTIDSKAKFEGMNRLSDGSVFLNSSMGYASYASDHSFIKNTVIGRYTCIANEIMTVVGNHLLSFASVHPAFYSTTQKLSYELGGYRLIVFVLNFHIRLLNIALFSLKGGRSHEGTN